MAATKEGMTARKEGVTPSQVGAAKLHNNGVTPMLPGDLPGNNGVTPMLLYGHRGRPDAAETARLAATGSPRCSTGNGVTPMLRCDPLNGSDVTALLPGRLPSNNAVTALTLYRQQRHHAALRWPAHDSKVTKLSRTAGPHDKPDAALTTSGDAEGQSAQRDLCLTCRGFG